MLEAEDGAQREQGSEDGIAEVISTRGRPDVDDVPVGGDRSQPLTNLTDRAAVPSCRRAAFYRYATYLGCN